MRKILVFILVAVFSLSLFLPANAETNGKVEFVLFHSKTCPHCKEEIKFIDSELRPKYGEQVDFQLYEISEPQNQKLMAQYVYFYKAQSGSVPLTFVGDEWLVGYDKDKTTGKRLVELI